MKKIKILHSSTNGTLKEKGKQKCSLCRRRNVPVMQIMECQLFICAKCIERISEEFKKIAKNHK